MKRRTTSEQWRHDQILAQEYADDKLTALQPQIEDYSDQLESLYTSGADTDTLRAFIKEVTDNLDAEWPYPEDSLLVSGTWQRGELVREVSLDGAQYDVVRAVDEPVYRIARSLGFIVVQDADTGTPHIKLLFDVGEHTVNVRPTPLGRYEAHFYATAFGSVEELSLSPVFDTTPASIEEIHEHLATAETRYHERTQEGSSFYDLSSRRQYELFDTITGRVHDATPSPASGIALDIAAAARQLYYSDPSLDGQPALSLPEAGTAYTISGSVLGVSLINAWHSVRSNRLAVGQKRLRERDDLLDPETGLCLVVEPHEEMSHTPLYVPYATTKFELSLRDTK